MILQAHDISIERGGLRLLQNLSFSLKAGGSLVLRGPNGSGKTSLLRSLAGLAPIASGSVDYDPDDVCFFGHLDGVKSAMSVAENLRFWASVYGQSNMDGAIELFELGPILHKLGGHLSAGQKRRVGLSRLLISRAKIWLMDEPTVSLDQAKITELAEIVKTHLASGGVTVLSTHADWPVESAVCDLSKFKPHTSNPLAFGEALE